ncbi:MAG: cytochrome [Actinomycetia bacterium]|nr:cytochrome [Actinomycetes bacterium]
MSVTTYDPYAAEVMEDPYPYYAWLREHAPLFHDRVHGFWVISRFADVHWALRNHDVFSSTDGVGAERRPVPMMISLDPPDHTRLRRIVQHDFVPTSIARWTPRVQELVDARLDDALARDSVDWTRAVAHPLPIQVIAEMLGVPTADRDQFKVWSDDVLDALGGGLSSEQSIRVEAAITEFSQYMYAVILDRRERQSDDDDLISLLLNPRKGEILTNSEIVNFVMLLLVAGNETTTNLIGNLALALAQNPDQWERLKADPGLVPQAVEEILRIDSPIQGFFRNTVTAVERDGVTIPAGEKVMMLFGSANHDPGVFPDPERFDVTRPAANHLGFGSGIHLCLGAPVARLEVTLLLRSMLERVDHLELTGDAQRTRNPLLRGVAHLPLRVVPA